MKQQSNFCFNDEIRAIVRNTILKNKQEVRKPVLTIEALNQIAAKQGVSRRIER